MSFVNLVSGGLDSTLITIMAKEEGIDVSPLFINYGQLAAKKEWDTCKLLHEKLQLPTPINMNLSGYGQVIKSGLTSSDFNIKDQAFTPCRNFLFLLMGAAYAHQLNLTTVAIGLLNEEFSLFPDQTTEFIINAERAISSSLGKPIEIINPLSEFSKEDVIMLAKEKGLIGTYSCHTGESEPCGQCIACLEFGNYLEK
tara:strand:+ start:24038 stop:24631 length:594 start_codon:yes stop_codon:yes gene_type:complete